MNRRIFSKSILISSAAYNYPFVLNSASTMNQPSFQNIPPGSKVGLICPGSPITEKKLETAISNVRDLGFEPHYTPRVMLKNGYLAGTDQERLDDLHEMYGNTEIKAIWCVRGGYGCTRLLEKIDYKLIKKNPKPLIGYSDITALLNVIQVKTKSPCYHGPVGSSPLTDFTKSMLVPVITNYFPHIIPLSKSEIETPYYVISPGIAEGRLVGGNLSIIAALHGTPNAIKCRRKLVFIEDVGEKPYRIDRMLTQLLDAGFFDQVSGLILGEFSGCDDESESSLTLKEVLKDRLEPLGIPTVYGFSFGHIDNQCSFPIGCNAVLNTQKQIVTLLR